MANMPKHAISESSSTAIDDLVSIPDDLFSEESDFHGNPQTRSMYTKLAASYNPQRHWDIHEWNAQVAAVRGRAAQRKAAKLRAKELAERRAEAASKGLEIRKDRKQLEEQDTSVKDEPAVKILTRPVEDKMDLDADTESPSTDNDEKQPLPQNHYEGVKSAKQLSESLSDFLNRLPASTTKILDAGPWIWIANPFPRTREPSGRHSSNSETGDGRIATFRQLGSRLLEGYSARKQDLETQNPGKKPGSITRMLGNDRVKLETDIRNLAKEQRVTAGKWMLFPPASDVDHVWAIVAKGVLENQLGISAKVATATGDAEPSSPGSEDDNSTTKFRNDGNQRLICIYTADFSDKEDVIRVLRGIYNLGLLLDQDASHAGADPVAACRQSTTSATRTHTSISAAGMSTS